MITDKIEGIVHLIENKNIVTIRALIDFGYITREAFMLSLKRVRSWSTTDSTWMREILDLVDEYFSGFVIENESHILDLFISNLMGPGFDEHIFLKLTDLGATVPYPGKLCHTGISTESFFYYATKNDLQINSKIINSIGYVINKSVFEWMFEQWLSQDITSDLQELYFAIANIDYINKKYFERVLQRISNQVDIDAVILITMAKHWSCDGYIMEYIYECRYPNEIKLYHLIQTIWRKKQQSEYISSTDVEKFKLFVKSNADANKIEGNILKLSICTLSDYYNLLNQLTLLVNIFND
jgi:hypothetical protein